MMRGIFSAIFVMTLTFQSITSLVPNERPGCKDSCSNEVMCAVVRHHCIQNFTNSKQVASHPTDLKYTETRAGDYKHFDLEWTPPIDASFLALTGFDVHVNFVSHGDLPGQRDSICYNVNIVDPKWIDIYSNKSVKFYLHCIRLPVTAFMTMRVTVYSLPQRYNWPKIVSEEIVVKPEFDHGNWEPDLKHWVDDDNNVHVRITNPHPDAMFYKVDIIKGLPDRMVLEFNRIFPAQHVEMKDQTKSMTVLDENHVPHFLIKDIPTTNFSYAITVTALRANKTEIPGGRVRTSFAPFEFTKKQVPDTSPSVTSESKSDPGVSVQELCTVVVVIILTFACLGFIIWKVKCQLVTSHPLLTCKFLVPSLSNNTKDLPKIIPIYCEENEDFVKAVESHVTLLHRYVNVLPVHHCVGSRSGSQWCPCLRLNPLPPDSEMKITDIIIYLSPGLGRLVQNDHTRRLSRLDEFCHRTLQSLQLQRREEFTIHIVTFDCFQDNELECLHDLSNMFALGENTTPTRQSTTPIKLAAFKQNSWRLENLDQLLCHLCRVQDFPQELPAGVLGWHENPEAKIVEQYLNRFGTPPTNRNDNSQSTSHLGLTSASNPGGRPEVMSYPYQDSRVINSCSNNGTAKQFSADYRSSLDVDTAFSSQSSHTQMSVFESSDDSSGLYSSEKGMLYTKLSPAIADHEKLAVDISSFKDQSVHYTHDKQDNRDVCSDHALNIFSPQSLESHYIKPPPSAMLHQNNCEVRRNSSPESESDNENFSGPLESDSLLSVDNNSLDTKWESKEKYPKRNYSASAISPPSSLGHTLKDSISDLIKAHNTTRGWNGASFA